MPEGDPPPPASPTGWRIDFQPVGRRAEIQPGASLLEAARQAGVEIISLCGGEGLCNSCKVRWLEGDASPLTLGEQEALGPAELESGYRLACQAIPLGDCRVELPPESLASPQRLQLDGEESANKIDLPLKILDLRVAASSLSDLRPDATRLLDALQEAGIPSPQIGFPMLSSLSDQLHRQGWQARLLVRPGPAGDELVALLPHPDTAPSQPLGLAIDIGTTKLALYLVDLASGKTLARLGAMNPQIAYGEDVISRIHFAETNPNGRRLLQEYVMVCLNRLVAEACTQVGALPEQIVEVVAVGNTAMHHLFAGLPVRQLGVAPYVPALGQAISLRTGQVGLAVNPGASIYLPPNIAGYVGGDHVAMLLATLFAPHRGGSLDEILSSPRTAIALDIGTNTEISLLHRGRLLSCSCASGPAFEGAHIQAGMRAAPGAIERVQIAGKQVRVFTIGGKPPVGLCGSGILDAVAEVLQAGAIDSKGNFVANHHLLSTDLEGGYQVVLVPADLGGHGHAICLTRQDVSEIQLAKGAIRAGTEVLLSEAGISSQEVDEFYIAGAFGTYLDIHSAVRIGMFPSLPLQRFRQVGNAAGSGARQLLLSSRRRQLAQSLAERVEYIELTVHPAFTNTYVKSIMF